jgi:guanyl-specific ribonuclease Sa
MKSLRLIAIVLVGLFVLYTKFTAVSSSNSTGTAPAFSPAGSSSPADASIPTKVLNVLQIVRSTGLPPEGYVGGKVFQNREGRLPASGNYREFDVDPHNGGRNAERIIVEWNTKQAWYTDDHYQTFTPLP